MAEVIRAAALLGKEGFLSGENAGLLVLNECKLKGVDVVGPSVSAATVASIDSCFDLSMCLD